MSKIGENLHDLWDRVDGDALVKYGVSFMSAHLGCMTTLAAGTMMPVSSLAGSVVLSAAGMLGVDHMIKKLAPEGCSRCATSSLAEFKRQGKLIAQAGLIGTAMWLSHQAGDHHGSHKPESSTVQTTPDGRKFMVFDLCGSDGVALRKDTLWLNAAPVPNL